MRCAVRVAAVPDSAEAARLAASQSGKNVEVVDTNAAAGAQALVVLSTAKFTLVVMFYMHLKADSRFFTFLFGAPLMLAVAVMIALMFIFYGTLTLRGAAGAG